MPIDPLIERIFPVWTPRPLPSDRAFTVMVGIVGKNACVGPCGWRGSIAVCSLGVAGGVRQRSCGSCGSGGCEGGRFFWECE
jgi:hypothetical protein